MTSLSNQEFRIEIANEQDHPVDGDPLIAAARLVLETEGIESAELSIAIVDDPAIRKLNNTYLGHDYETDVISFLLDDDPETGFLSGQLIVSADTAARLAGELGIAMNDELLLYVVHGTLHLVGFDDKQPELATNMRTAERRYLQQLGVEYHWSQEDDPTAARGGEAT